LLAGRSRNHELLVPKMSPAKFLEIGASLFMKE
jgi:hypothetical protein